MEQHTANRTDSEFPEQPATAGVIVLGGGVVGCSVAYHLAKLGTDVLLLERDQLTSGTTWHAAGLLSEFRGTRVLTELARYSVSLYEKIAEETGQATGLKRNGSVAIATGRERWEELRRGATIARSLGIQADQVSASDVAQLWPLAHVNDVVGAVYYPNDGQINPVDVTMALAKGARLFGARILEKTPATDVVQRDGQVQGVETSNGYIATEVIVNCTGMWARELGRLSGVNIPLHACEHFYCLTEPIADLPSNLPVMRDFDGCAYYKEDAGKLLIGAFEPLGKPWGVDGIPKDFSFSELPEDLEHMAPILEGAVRRVPRIGETGISRFFNGPESFTSDNRYLIGEAPELKGYFIAAGFNSIGIQSAGGVGMAIAEWITRGYPPPDLWEVNVQRTFPFQNKSEYLRDRVSETLGMLYGMHWPYRQYETSRDILVSPLHKRLLSEGACFGESAGWERANWFGLPGTNPRYEYSYGPQNWFHNQRNEHESTRTRVAIYDQTSFAKFDVTGPDAECTLERICANNVGREVGSITYTQWLNPRAGIEADVTVSRIAEHAFRIITAPTTRRKDWHWLLNHIPAGADCSVSDVTEEWAVLGLMGPRSRTLLSSLTHTNLDNEMFPFGTGQELEIAGITLWAQRVTYVGELGWELYCPWNAALELFCAVFDAGKPLGSCLAGYHSLDSCRIEKAYRHWGHDIGDGDTPLEAGLGFACAFEKEIPFIGKDALLRQRDKGVTRRLTQFLLRDEEARPYHDEPIYRDGEQIGYVTSANYGHTLGGNVALGYIAAGQPINQAFINSGMFEIEIAGTRFPAAASLRPMYDPNSLRVKQ
ncbi:MAG: FAD-dependent oxidoreductase [Pseudomonadales bacterium]